MLPELLVEIGFPSTYTLRREGYKVKAVSTAQEWIKDWFAPTVGDLAIMSIPAQ